MALSVPERVFQLFRLYESEVMPNLEERLLLPIRLKMPDSYGRFKDLIQEVLDRVPGNPEVIALAETWTAYLDIINSENRNRSALLAKCSAVWKVVFPLRELEERFVLAPLDRRVQEVLDRALSLDRTDLKRKYLSNEALAAFKDQMVRIPQRSVQNLQYVYRSGSAAAIALVCHQAAFTMPAHMQDELSFTILALRKINDLEGFLQAYAVLKELHVTRLVFRKTYPFPEERVGLVEEMFYEAIKLRNYPAALKAFFYVTGKQPEFLSTVFSREGGNQALPGWKTEAIAWFTSIFQQKLIEGLAGLNLTNTTAAR